jgi:hypothetical protein
MSRAVAVVAFPALLLASAHAQEGGVTSEQRDAALAKAFRHLDEQLWKLEDGGSPRRQYSMAVAGWAYLLASDKAGKTLPARKQQIDRIHDELLRYVERVEKQYGREAKRKPPPTGPDGFPMDFEAMYTAQFVWPLSVAAPFFAECAARGKHAADSKRALKSIVAILERAQQENGGWGHDDASRPGMGLPPIRIPKPGGGELTYPGTLLAASHCALSGLGFAHAFLGTKRAESLERGRAYFGKAQNANGTFPYDPSQRHDIAGAEAPMMGAIEVARTAGAVFALYCAGTPADDAAARKALDAIDAQPDLVSEGHGSATMALQFGALLARGRGDRAWQTFRAIYFPRILKEQAANGACSCVCKHEAAAVTCDTAPIPGMPGAAEYAAGNKIYVTAIHALVLALDRTAPRVLPTMPAPKGPVTPDR